MEKESIIFLTVTIIVFLMILFNGMARVEVKECRNGQEYSYTSLYGYRYKRKRIDNHPRCVLATTGHKYNINLRK